MIRSSIGRVLLLIFLSVLVLSGCSSGSDESIVGRWEDSEVPELVLEFFDDGTFTETFSGQLILAGIYEIDQGLLKLSYNPPCGNGNARCPWDAEISFADGRLMLNDGSADIIYDRLP